MIIFIAIYEAIMLMVLMVLLNNMNNYNNELNEHINTRSKLTQVSLLLRQSSNYLTHFARSYVVTGDNKFKKQYFEVLDIRNGKKPRPLNYDALYWDLPKNIREDQHPPTSQESLKDIINSLPFSKYERKKLQKAERKSNKLINLEMEAFNAMIGKFKNKNGIYTVEGKINQKLAIDLLHSSSYYKAKSKIMIPIDFFLVMLDFRTKEIIGILNNKIEKNYYLFIFFVFIFIISNIFVFIFIRKKDKKDKKDKDKLIKNEQNLINQLEDLNKNLQVKIEERTKELETAFKDIREINKKVSESIECALMIQNSILPPPDILIDYFSEFNIIWKPKDIVGGDIYFIDKISEDEIVIFFIDCTGHGVPGAFLTVLLRSVKDKAIEDYKTKNITIGNILEHLYCRMGEILHNQPNFDFDGLIMSYNKKTKEVKLASSGGYAFRQNIQRTEFIKLKRPKRCKLKSDYRFETTKIDVSNENYLYMTTDGFIDQKGGKENFPLGKSKLITMFEKYKNEPTNKHKELFMKYFNEYKKDNERLDDVMIMSIKI